MASLKDTVNPSEVLANATLRAALLLDVNEKQLASILGVDEAFLVAAIEPASCPGLRAQQLIRIYQRLSAMTGNDRAAMSHWMTTSNRRFNCNPRERMQNPEGLDEVVSYLDSLEIGC